MRVEGNSQKVSKGAQILNNAVIFAHIHQLPVSQSRNVEAEPLFERSQVVRGKAQGLEHPNVARSRRGCPLNTVNCVAVFFSVFVLKVVRKPGRAVSVSLTVLGGSIAGQLPPLRTKPFRRPAQHLRHRHRAARNKFRLPPSESVTIPRSVNVN